MDKMGKRDLCVCEKWKQALRGFVRQEQEKSQEKKPL